jgi:uncharacterized protein YciI
MPLFVIYCVDKPGAIDLRLATRETHLAYARSLADTIKLGGPMLNANGDMVGSLAVIEVEDEAAAEAFNKADPYAKVGLWERVEIRPFRAVLGPL